jgi:hypothetical protein
MDGARARVRHPGIVVWRLPIRRWRLERLLRDAEDAVHKAHDVFPEQVVAGQNG